MVILVACIDPSAMIQEKRRYGHGSGAMQGSPRVDPFRFDQRRVGRKHRCQLVGEPCPRRLMHLLIALLLHDV
jgi:hypothetical protein